jgi:hypothetical protein
MSDDIYITPVLLLCATCQSPIKAWINSSQWIRCEWVSPNGERQECHRKRKKKRDGS